MEHVEKQPAEMASDERDSGSLPNEKSANENNDALIFNDDAIERPPRVYSPLDIISAGFNICNSWTGLAATMFLAIFQGGPVTILYGCIVVFFLTGSSALSLAEMAARYPTAGGQYHWTALLAPQKFSRGLSYTCGSINFFSWIAICAGVCIIIPQLILGVVVFYNENFEIKAWHSFLIYQALNIAVLAYNLLVLRRAPWTHDIGFFMSLLCFFVFLITCVAIASPKQPSSYVWTTFVNQETGWTNAAVFLTGLVNPAFMYSGIDGAIHLAEDAVNASTAVPWALISTILIGFGTAFPFVMAMFYCISDFDAVLNTPTHVPIYEIWHQATKSSTCATIFLVFLLFTGIFALNASQQTASRLVFSFARDDALIFSKQMGTIHGSLGVPVYALFFNSFIVFVIGCVYLGSTTAFNAIIGTGLVLQQITFAFPAALLMFRGRAPEYLPTGKFNFGALGWVFNIVTVLWAILSTVVFSMPLDLPVSGGTMNYTSAVLGCMAIFSVANWFGYARKHYKGPRIAQRVLETQHENVAQ